MPVPNPQLPASGTLPDLLLTLTAVSGEFPAALVRRLPAAVSYQASVVKQLKREGLLRSFSRDGLKGLRLTMEAKRLLLAAEPDCFTPYLSGKAETNQLKSEVPRRLRLHRMAEVLMAMFNANVLVFPWEKHGVFKPGFIPGSIGLRFGYPAYYSSREVKEIGKQKAMIHNARATGVLVSDSGVFAVYNMGPFQMRWTYKSEMRLKHLLETDLIQHRLPKRFLSVPLGALVFGSTMEQLGPLMRNGTDHNYFVLDGSYNQFCFLTLDHPGEMILRLLCEPALRDSLDRLLRDGLEPPRPSWWIENDAVAPGEVPVLFAYTCDMLRIRRFNSALERQERRGILICFDFQYPALQSVCGQLVSFQCIDFKQFERSIRYVPEG